MPVCRTRYHGPVEYTESSVLNFPRGLFGFEEQTHFVPIELPTTRPLVFLQSLSTPELCFLTLPVFVVEGNYRLSMSPDDLDLIGLPNGRPPRIGEDVLCLVLVAVREGQPTTANLMAPVVVNIASGQAVQALAEENTYSHQFPFLQPAGEYACS